MIKTGVSIILALWVAVLLELEPPAYAAIAAISAIQPSIYKSYQSVRSNVRGSLIGAIVAVAFYYMLGNSPFVIGLVVVIVMAIQRQFKTKTTITLPAVTVIAIMAGTPTEGFLYHAFKRLSLALVGLGSSIIVNFVFIPPKFEQRLFEQIIHNSEEMSKTMRLLARRETAYGVLKEDIETFRKNRHNAEELFEVYKEERVYSRKKRFSKGRKLVIFRQMIQTNQLALDVLKTLHRHANVVKQAPADLQNLIQEQLEYLSDLHERTLMTFSGKTRSDLSSELTDTVTEKRDSLSTTFMSYYKNEEQWLLLFPAVAIILDYHENIIHLDKLINGFQTFHEEENQFE